MAMLSVLRLQENIRASVVTWVGGETSAMFMAAGDRRT